MQGPGGKSHQAMDSSGTAGLSRNPGPHFVLVALSTTGDRLCGVRCFLSDVFQAALLGTSLSAGNKQAGNTHLHRELEGPSQCDPREYLVIPVGFVRFQTL